METTGAVAVVLDYTGISASLAVINKHRQSFDAEKTF